jgi:AraC-like DNA-binding protein
VSVQPTSPGPRRELLDAVVDGGNTDVAGMARSSHSSEFHFSREVSRLTGEPPAALRRRVMLERAAWRLQRGEGVAAVAVDEGWSSPEVFSRAFRRTFGVPPSQAHDVADTAHLISRAAGMSEDQWAEPISPGQVVLDWDGEEPSVGAVLGAIVWSKEVWLASIEGRDLPAHPGVRSPDGLAADHDEVATRWTSMVVDYADQGRLADTVIDALCDPPESFQLYGIVAHVLTYSAHRRELARTMLARHGIGTKPGDPLDWMRGN